MAVRLLSSGLALVAAAAVAEAKGPYTIDATKLDRVFDGHGGLSAGASSRLLYDYEEPYRSDILDYLYKPSFGAQLTICKVEIGGDVQSTNGAEASHMHTSKDLNLHRGYEFWLMAEAKKRNPQVRTYVLSWGVPGWVGNGTYFSPANIEYQTAFVKGARDVYNISVDYLGIWNERPWGNVEYVMSLRKSLDAAGLTSTQLVGSDGGIPGDQIKALQSDPAFAAAEHIQGTHYPCARDQPPQFWEITPKQTYWANEDFSTIGGDWAGGSCWGRSLNQNFVKLNATATISWSTIWSVYDSWRYFGNGLMYAMEPWSGNYTVPPAIWTSAHVNQFVEPGWHFLGGEGSGLLPGGGSWTVMVPSPSASHTNSPKSQSLGARLVDNAGAGDFTLVLEKLEGDCLRCKVPATTAETVSFTLTGALKATSSLSMWLTNGTISFAKMADLEVTDGSFHVELPRDTMITLSTTTGQVKGVTATSTCTGDVICSGVYKPFPFPFNASYDDGEEGRMAKFHADNGGAFEIRSDADGSDGGGKHLLQASPRYPAGTQWAGNFDPITSLGATDWVNYQVSVDVMLMAPVPEYAQGDPLVPLPTEEGLMTDWFADPISTGVYGGVCVRQIDQFSSGFCLLVGAGLVKGGPDAEQSSSDNATTAASEKGWVLQAGAMGMRRDPGTALASGSLPTTFSFKTYHRLSLRVQGQELIAELDGEHLAAVKNTDSKIPPAGQAALRSSYTYTQFDKLVIDGPEHGAYPDALFDKHLIYPPKAAPGGPQDPATQLTSAHESMYGCAFTVGEAPMVVEAVARFGSGFVAEEEHTVTIIEGATKKAVGSAKVALGGNATAGQGGDLNGYVWAALDEPLTLAAGKQYFLVSSEGGVDTYFDQKVWMQSHPGLLSGLVQPVSKDAGGDWVVGGGGSGGGVPLSPGDLHYIVSKSTRECWDTRGAAALDLWACVQDGHNELFNYSASTGLITTGPRDAVGGKCIKATGAAVAAAAAAAASSGEREEDKLFPPSSSIAACDASDKSQVFEHTSTGQLRLRSNPAVCMTAGPKGDNAGVTLSKCAPGPDQEWTFEKSAPGPPAPPPSKEPKLPEWGQSFGPLNLRLKKKKTKAN